MFSKVWSPILRAALATLALTIILFGSPTTGVSATPSPTERGLDIWIHASTEGIARDVFALDVQAVGFPTATSTTPLDGATVEAAWDPETLVDPTAKTKPATAPPAVSALSDAQGRATLEIPVPDGRAKELTLLVSVRVGDKQRVREITVQRVAAEVVELFVSDPRVVPGDNLPAWVLFSTRDRSKPIAGTPIEIKLTQGGIARFRRTLTTDASGSAVVKVPIPRDPDPAIAWSLTATVQRPAFASDAGSAPHASLTLTGREERPGKAHITAQFEEGSVTAGGKVHARARLEDPSGEAVVSQPIWVWTGPRGTEAPKDDKEFKAAAQKLVTDGAGYVRLAIAAPTTVPLRGTTLAFAARTELEGQKLESSSSIEVGRPHGTVDLTAEAGELVPGLEQKLYLSVYDDAGEPVTGTFHVKGDGLDSDVVTNAFGEGATTWKVPKGVGAMRNSGPCPGSIATAVSLKLKSSPKEVKAFDGALTGTDGLPLCVAVDRDATVLIRPKVSVIRAGEKLDVDVVGSDARPVSIIMDRDDGARSLAVWTTGPKATLTIPESASGIFTLHAAMPGGKLASTVASTSILTVPKTLPKVDGRVLGGRAVPHGVVKVEARVTDEKGAPVVGSVAAVVIDKFGGGSFGNLEKMDTRGSLCRSVAYVEPERCASILSGGDDSEVLRRMSLRARAPQALAPLHDPGGAIDSGMRDTFRTVVRSLEGAVYQSSQAPETLPDVRRVEGGKSRFNPEMMTLVTEAMSGTPETPGGEPLVLSDIIAMDSQVTYDNVARRVTRLKLFQVLSAVRDLKMQSTPDPDEPANKDPNALLRKLLRDSTLSDANLLDPWGGHISFTKIGGTSSFPFFQITPGWELHSPGPDGKLGSADDVKSPFERVLKSGTPYAEAVEEDTVVDAKVDLRVADSTIAAWGETLTRATGTALGDEGGIGLSGIGSGGGGGSGFGSGLGRLGGSRVTRSVAAGIEFASPPVRTDENGRVVLDIPLGDIETTWSVALVAIPDAARPAMSVVDVPVTVPLSSKVNAGSVWTEGDSAEAVVVVRNRSDKDQDVTLTLSAGGGLSLVDGEQHKTVKVKAQGAANARVKLRATASGMGTLHVLTSAPGLPDDDLVHEIEIRRKGELLRIARATYVTSTFDFTPYLKHAPMVPAGVAALVLERGERTMLEGALDALAPEKLGDLESLAEALDAASIVRAHAINTDGDGSKLAARGLEVGRAAAAKLFALSNKDHRLAFSLMGRAQISGVLTDEDAVPGYPECPFDSAETILPVMSVAAGLDAEPAPVGGATKDCWAKYVVGALNRIRESDDPAAIARAVLALSTRPHRRAESQRMSNKLIALVNPTKDGTITMPSRSTRASRALVYAALLVVTDPNKEPAWRVSLFRWLMVQRDAQGSFGSAAATHAAIEALVRDASYRSKNAAPETVVVDFGKAGKQEITLAAGDRRALMVPPGASSVIVTSGGTGVLARMERDFLRPFDVAPSTWASPVLVHVTWPIDVHAGRIGTLSVKVTGGSDAHGPVHVKIPLPPGVTLGDNLPEVKEVQGILHITLSSVGVNELEVPIRFTLAGTFTAPEATARLRDQAAEVGYDRARPLTVLP